MWGNNKVLFPCHFYYKENNEKLKLFKMKGNCTGWCVQYCKENTEQLRRLALFIS